MIRNAFSLSGKLNVNEQVEERRPVIAATFRAVQFVWEIERGKLNARGDLRLDHEARHHARFHSLGIHPQCHGL
jgi:hypothetical protein